MTDAEKIEALEYKVAVAYQIVGAMLACLPELAPSEDDEREALDYLAGVTDEDPLPWPKEWRKVP